MQRWLKSIATNIGAVAIAALLAAGITSVSGSTDSNADASTPITEGRAGLTPELPVIP